ncbi:ABC transporter ATP-binding protein [Lactobacillus psittaci]|uniref:Multidrug ABC superfamily ATP binding cassette transporter, ABC protein n=1 Tax=Lactobacillus psittaci DSM 15354 TaxID=1122152 RepID=A0A0R1S533_9LACO|nr:ABC transporter transmembrane domain-containing protein [Lactobacillus psittaci]KRL64012.1 multidrug ABC superfamily ATP binding cassette transporter, ABC protein [Lactobacillus psittaci DSM 15354]
MDIFKKLSWFFKKYKKRYTIGILFLILTSFANLVPPLVLGKIAEKLSLGQISWTEFFLYLFGILLAALLLYLFRFVWRSYIWGGAQYLEKEFRSKLYAHFLKMDASFYLKHRTGDLMAHATNDLTAINLVAGDGVLSLVDALFTGGTTIIAMMVFVDWRLTLFAMLPMPLLAVMARKLGVRLHAAYDASQAAFSELNNHTQESLKGIKVLKAFNQADEDARVFNDLTFKTIKINRRVFKIDSLYDPLTTLIIGATYIITIVYGGYLVQNNQINIGQLVSFIAYIGALDWPLFAIGYLFNLIERGSASYDRVMKILSEKSAIIDHSENKEIPENPILSANIKSFSYPDDQKQLVLKDIEFELKPGQTLGLVGKVGSGKTSLIELIMRDFDNYQGKITLGDQDIRQLSMDAYLNQIAYVPQENFLFSMSVRDNIAFSNPTASQAEIETAAKLAALHEDILAFPDGYDTLIGENGVSLSGGQRQRMAIARALLKNSQLLILDDALSAVDAKTETEILSQLRKQTRKRSVVISAHRLSSVMKADLILVLKNGQVVERGTHDELLALGGWYKEMWDKQELAKEVGEENE